MTALSLLHKARTRIANPKRWAKGWFAFDHFRQRCNTTDERAAKWCAYGAMMAEDPPESVLVEAEKRLMGAMHGADISNYNDSHDHHEVLRAFDRAIGRLSRKSAVVRE